MKKAFLIGILLGGSLAYAYGGMQTVAQETQAASRAAPTASSFTSAASLNLTNIDKFRVMVCTYASNDAPQASGKLKAWLYDERTGLVARNQLLDLDLSTQAAPGAGNCIQFPDQAVGVPADRVLYATSSLLLTDGGTLATVGTLSDGGPSYDAGAFVVYYRGWYIAR